ncbi:MAG: M48 family metalloprotease, partial [Gemmatimonadota bacterium]|nr:M48 family metalloprotease [Gemmatimonadota bacterium]
MRFHLSVLSILSVLPVLTGCAVNPATGQRQFSLVSEGQEIAMGQEGAQQVEASIGLYPDSALQAFVSRVGMSMASKSERPTLPWRFGVVEDAAINAFALPGGPIYFTRGILTHMNSEAEMASVMGHEIGHVTARHSAQMMSRAQVAQIGLGVGSILSSEIASVAGAASTGLGLLFLKYGRDAESQADELGFRYMMTDGYDPRAMRDMFIMLSRVTGEAGRLPNWLSSHPDPDNRLERTDERLAELNRDLSAAVVGRQAFMRMIDGIVFGENPRSGYFVGQEFLHPDLKFRMTFPSGWKTHNGTDAVTSISAAEDAILELRLAAGADPAAALRAFAAQEGLTSNQPESGSLNGLPAAAAEWQAQTEQGVLRGRVVFVAYEGRTYRIMGYTALANYGAYRQAFVGTQGSFARVTEASILNRQPNRLRVVTLPRAMTLREFHAAYPSVVPVEQVALINAVDLDARLAQGRQVK